MPPKKKCNCRNHPTYSDGKTFRVHKVGGNVYKKRIVEYLVKKGDLGQHSTYLCSSCASYADEHLAEEKINMAGSVSEQTLIGVNIINGADQGKQPTRLGVMVVSASILDGCVDRLRAVLEDQLVAIPSNLIFCTKQGWSITKSLETSIMVRSILSDEDGSICIQPSYDKPKVGIKSRCGTPLGFVFVDYTSKLSAIRGAVYNQLFHDDDAGGSFLFLDPNGWPVTGDQEDSLSLFDILHGNCVLVSVTMAISLDHVTSPDIELPCKRPRLLGSSPVSFRSVKDHSRCLAPESPNNATESCKQILISYVRAEAAQHAVELKNQLSALGCSVYLDVDEIHSGVDWQDSLNYAVSNCEIFLPLVTPVYGETQWTNREVKLADILGKFILPINFLEEWPPRCLAIQFATTQYIAWKTPTQIQTELAEGCGESVYDCQVWKKNYIASVASKVAERVNLSQQISTVPSLVKRKTIVKSCAMVSRSNPQAITSNRDGLPLIVICLHPQQLEHVTELREWLQEEGYEVWMSTQLDINYPDSLPDSPTVRFSQASQSSFCEEERNNNATFQEMADDAGVILAVLSTEFGASRTCQQQVYYCEHRKRLISVTMAMEGVEFPLWVNMLMGKETWLNIQEHDFKSKLLSRIQNCLDPHGDKAFTTVGQDAMISQRVRLLKGRIHTQFCVCVIPGDVSVDMYRSILSELTALEDVTMVTCPNVNHGDNEVKGHGSSVMVEELHRRYRVVTVAADTQCKINAVTSVEKCAKQTAITCGQTVQDRDAAVAGVCDLCVLICGDHTMEPLIQEFLWNDRPVIPVLWNDRPVIPVLCPPLIEKLDRIHQMPPRINPSDWSLLSDHSVTADVLGPAVKVVTWTLLGQELSPPHAASPSRNHTFKTPDRKVTSPKSLKAISPQGQKVKLCSQPTVIL